MMMIDQSQPSHALNPALYVPNLTELIKVKPGDGDCNQYCQPEDDDNDLDDDWRSYVISTKQLPFMF